MEFYVICRTQSGAYALAEEGNGTAVKLSNQQLGRIADRLSHLFWQQSLLPLNIRIYMTAYYSDGKTEYISVKSTPSLLIGEERLHRRYGQQITLDGFALTFLEGEEENRVWIGEDGVVENRGSSGQKVREMLEILVEALNAEPCREIILAKQNVALNWSRTLTIVSQWTQAEYFAPWLDLNQEEISWCAIRTGETQWQQLSLQELLLEEPQQALRLTLLAPAAYYELLIDLFQGQLVLYQHCQPWEESRLPEALWQQIIAEE